MATIRELTRLTVASRKLLEVVRKLDLTTPLVPRQWTEVLAARNTAVAVSEDLSEWLAMSRDLQDMRKKDWMMVAEAIKATPLSPTAKEVLVNQMIGSFRAKYPKFDAAVFTEACGVVAAESRPKAVVKITK